jgi:hypothetical protein
MPKKDKGLCLLCPPGREQRAIESHHLRPLEYGGDKDGEQINICETCHGKVHRIANSVYSGNLELSSIGNPLWNMAVSMIVEQRKAFDSGEVKAVDARRRITASLSEEELRRAHRVKVDLGYSSLEAMIKGLINNAYDSL